MPSVQNIRRQTDGNVLFTSGIPADAHARMRGNETMKIFIVDDSELVVEGLRAVLSDIEGLEFIGQAATANDAVEAILRLQPDVVILDIRLIGGNGMNVLKRIKKEHSSPVVIMLTNYPYPQYRNRCKELGAEYFFDKVTEFEDFVAALTRLARAPSQRELPL